jgi:hypothetical protein
LAAGFRLNKNLVSVSIVNASLRDSGAGELADMLSLVPTLEVLDVGENGISHIGMGALSRAVSSHCTRLKSLRISWNLILESGFIELSPTFEACTRLTSLDMSMCQVCFPMNTRIPPIKSPISSFSAPFLGCFFGMTLHLPPQPGPGGLDAMEKSLKSTCLTALEIGYSMMGDEGAQCLSKIVSRNPNLKVMNVFNLYQTLNPKPKPSTRNPNLKVMDFFNLYQTLNPKPKPSTRNPNLKVMDVFNLYQTLNSKSHW